MLTIINKESLVEFLRDLPDKTDIIYIGEYPKGFLVFTVPHDLPEGAVAYWTKEHGLTQAGQKFIA